MGARRCMLGSRVHGAWWRLAACRVFVRVSLVMSQRSFVMHNFLVYKLLFPPTHDRPRATRYHTARTPSRTPRHCVVQGKAQRGAAIEILNREDGEAADREAARLRSAGS